MRTLFKMTWWYSYKFDSCEKVVPGFLVSFWKDNPESVSSFVLYHLIFQSWIRSFGVILLYHFRKFPKLHRDHMKLACSTLLDTFMWIPCLISQDFMFFLPFGLSQTWQQHTPGRFFCLVFEPLGSSLYDVIKKNRFRGFLVASSSYRTLGQKSAGLEKGDEKGIDSGQITV